MVRRYLAALLLLATPALAAVELDGDSNGAIDVAKGGTNATTAAGARTALGVQPLDSDLTSIAGMATTAWGRGLLDDADAAAGRTSLGIAPADTLNVAGVDLGTGSATTGLLRFYGNTKAFSFGIFSQGADGLGVGWRLPSTIPAATSLLTVDSSGYMAYLAPSAGPVTASGFDGNLTTDDDTLQEVAQKVDDLVISGAGDDLGSAAYSDVVALWTTCTGYLKSDGTCDTPSGSATYPSAAGVANWNGSAWGTSYTVGTAANNLVQLNASAQLPAVSADLLTITDTGSYFTTDTVGAALQELGGAPELFFDSGDFVEDRSVLGKVTVSLAAAYATEPPKEYIGWSVVNSDTATAVADGKLGASVPAGMNEMNLVDFTCSVSDLNSAASGATTVVLRRVRGGTAADMTSTGVTIDYNEYTASDEVIDTSNDDLATGDNLYVDIPTGGVTSPAQKGLHCTATFEAP